MAVGMLLKRADAPPDEEEDVSAAGGGEAGEAAGLAAAVFAGGLGERCFDLYLSGLYLSGVEDRRRWSWFRGSFSPSRLKAPGAAPTLSEGLRWSTLLLRERRPPSS
jgi:hypothetical protein